LVPGALLRRRVTEAGNSLSVLVQDDGDGWVIGASSLNRDDPPLAGA
jgi:hypothetical protein